ncbi:hypothetical protein CSB45_11105 [candidate division KSB3 bacterium]|uniref:Uncharacterized protein n=1 Tax=candidate division KSB3 bacterium TaxID=2044937 RepID=A0A2G6E3A6_9BACT|nr:MAG: hypothetical protein CSB45_11105 [candidate division KSB3 bacterium]PIE29043.1 MAG: hypothetical protein CSA57_10500 [candidate division KSB3 bacterium]
MQVYTSIVPVSDFVKRKLLMRLAEKMSQKAERPCRTGHSGKMRNDPSCSPVHDDRRLRAIHCATMISRKQQPRPRVP